MIDPMCNAMDGENQPPITYEPVGFGKQPVEVQVFMKITIILEESMEYTLY